MQSLNAVITFLMPIPLLALIFFIFGWIAFLRKPGYRSLPRKSFISLTASIVVILILHSILESKAYQHTLQYLKSLPTDYSLRVDNNVVEKKEIIVAALGNIQEVMVHHLRPSKKIIHIHLTSSHGNLNLDLRRDSGNSQEYSVYYPDLLMLKRNSLGSLATPVFDEY